MPMFLGISFEAIGAIIDGDLDCSNGRFLNTSSKAFRCDNINVRGSVRLSENFFAKEEVRFVGGEIGGNLKCSGGRFLSKDKNSPTLSADRVTVNGNVLLNSNFHSEGEVRFSAAKIGGNFNCRNGNFINNSGKAISAPRIKVGGTVGFGDNSKVRGEIILLSAEIDHDFVCKGGDFYNPEGRTLSADGIEVNGIVEFSNGFKSEGELRLIQATIGQDLVFDNSTFLNRKNEKIALYADGINVENNIRFSNEFTADGEVRLVGARIKQTMFWTKIRSPKTVKLDLRFANISFFVDDSKSWPAKGSLFLDGLVYNEIQSNDSSDVKKSRLDWLNLSGASSFRSQPYEQLAKFYQKSGQEKKSTETLYEKSKRRIKTMSIFKRSLSYLLLWPIGYGYYPLRVSWFFLIFVVLGTYLFRIGFRKQTILPSQEWGFSESSRKNYPKFNPFIYSLDLFIPLINLYQSNFWLPNPKKREKI